ncbi:pentatricopeptide repeat-containing protein [Carex littledalei]|uniref:Pentatricopeptide repeat-containing protein n=1 Tax=Carex littledalei TaxID=544730 RepID=A0A833QDQ1_9POAL|nr:pentatricopeptide repeat-containing protein [Carex littledalei]
MALKLSNLSKLNYHCLFPRLYLPLKSLSSLVQNLNGELNIAANARNPDVTTIFQIIINSPSPESMIKCLDSSQIPLSNDLIDQVLKRVRFSHANPLKTLEFFDFVDKKKGFYHTQYSYDTMLYILGRSRKFEETWRILKEMRRKDPAFITPKTVMIVLGRIAKVCSVRQTVESFKMFKRLCTNFDVSCFNALLRTLSQEKSMSDARNVYHSLKHEFKPNLITFNILLSGWKSVEEAESFFKEMQDLKIKPDLVTYNCLIDVYCKNRQLEKAHKVFDEMHEQEIYPDFISYTSLIGGLGLIGQPDKARAVLKEMRELGCYPDAAAYNAAMRNFCIAKRLGDAFDLMDEMIQVGLEPNATSFNLFFRCFYWANDMINASSLYQRMKTVHGCLPNTQTCMFLIRLCRRNGDVGFGLELWEDMVLNGFGSLTLVSDVLFDMLCDDGRLDEAEKCLFQMVEKGQRPSSVSVKRVRVLMELTKRHESLYKLHERMSIFEHGRGK